MLRLLDNPRHQQKLQMSQVGILSALLVASCMFAGFVTWSQTNNSQTTSHRGDATEISNFEPGFSNETPQPAAETPFAGKDAKLPDDGKATNDESQKVASNFAAVANELDESTAVKELEKLGGLFTRDDTLAGNPVKGIHFEAHSLFGDEHVYLLKSLPHLTELRLTWTLCTDVGMKSVGELTSLTNLMLVGNRQITNASMKPIGQLKDLTSLYLTSCKNITDDGVKEIGGLKNLTTLYLSNTSVTDACLTDLKGLDRLKHLGLDRTKVTNAGIKDLREALPNAQIQGERSPSKRLPRTQAKSRRNC